MNRLVNSGLPTPSRGRRLGTGFAYIAGRFARVEPRRRARAYLLGLLADVETRSCWQLAEHAGEASPHGLQRLLGEAVWDADKVRDDLRRYVADELGDPRRRVDHRRHR